MPLCGGNKNVQRKLVLLGDGASGKTSLLNVFTRGYFPTVYEPTVFENYVHDIFVDSVHIELSLWDTAGQEEFDRLRSLSYDDTDLIMLCYSVESKDSLENVESKWVGEIADNCPGVKLVLVALKCDLREQQEEDDNDAAPAGHPAAPGEGREKKPLITYEQGLEVARRIGASRYLECSAMRNRGVNEAFTEAARVALAVRKERDDSKCVIISHRTQAHPETVVHEEPAQQRHGLFSRRQPSSPRSVSPLSSDGMSSRGSSPRHGMTSIFSRRSHDTAHTAETHHSKRSSMGNGSVLHRGLNKLSGNDIDPSILKAREHVDQAEAAERDADKALEEARRRVRDAHGEMRRLEKEIEEEARRAKIKQQHAAEVSKRGKGLGRHGH